MNGIVESGSAEWRKDERQVDRRRQAGTEGEDGHAAGRQAALLAGIRGQPPGEDGERRADDTD